MTHILDNESYLPLFHYSSTLIVIITSLYCCIVRNFHLCRPFDKQADYFYPSRKIICWYFLVILFLVPYLFHLESLDTWLFFRCFYILYLPSFGSVVLRNYFFINVRLRIFHYTLSIGLPVLLLSPLWIIGCDGGDVLRPYYDIVSCVALILSIVVLIDLVLVTTKLMHIIQDYMYGEYSNEEDFPVRFAKSVVFIPLTLWLVSVFVFLTDSRTVYAYFSLFLSFVGITLLVFILHPHRSACKSIEKDMQKSVSSDIAIEEIGLFPLENVEITEELANQIEQQIRSVVEGRQLYLDPRFKRDELAKIVGTNRTYLSIVFRQRFNSFYNYINTLRIEYSIRFQQDHPECSRLEIAHASGFGSLRSYFRVKMLYDAGKL